MTEALARVPVGAAGRAARPARVLLALVVVVLSYGLMQTMLVPTIGALQRDLHTSTAAASWAVLSSTLLASAVLTPVVGRLGDRFGKRRLLLVRLGVYLVGTVGAVAAPGVGVLIGFRAVQGISLALLPLSYALVRELLPPARVPSGLALAGGGSVLLAVWHGEVAQVVLCYLVCSVGYGFAMAALPRLVNQASPAEHSGSANGVNTVCRVLGGALGSQLGAAMVAGGCGFGAAFWLSAAVAAVGGGLARCAGPSR